MFNDKDPKFFSPADKARIIEFVLKRERFDRERFSEEKGDPFAFGSIFCYFHTTKSNMKQRREIGTAPPYSRFFKTFILFSFSGIQFISNTCP